MKNKRKQKRFIKRYKTEFVLNNITFRGISRDFSLNGLFIRTKDSLVPGTILDIIVHLSDGLTSKLKGKVRRTSKNPVGKVMGSPVKTVKSGMGIEIIEKDTNYLHLIRYFLS